MKLASVSLLMVALFGLSANAQQKDEAAAPPQAPQTEEKAKSNQEDNAESPKNSAKKKDQDEDLKLSRLAELSDEELNKLLDLRLNGNLGMTFGGFMKLFLVQSRLAVGTGIGLMTDDKKIIRSELQPSFPESYEPTLRELLNAIALQTSSEWKYDREKQFIRTDQVEDKPVEGVVNIHFQRAKRKKPFQVNLAEDWKMEDKGHWVMYIPPDFPVGMDVYEYGSYSTKEVDKNAFVERIRNDVSLEWARRVNPETRVDDLIPAKVGNYDALFFDKLLKGNGRKIRWRQWVFMVDDRCFFIVSTIPPNLEEEIFPDVESMIQSFEMKE